MGLKVLSNNKIGAITTTNASTIPASNMLNHHRWKKWVGESETTTTISGHLSDRFGGDISEQTITSFAFCHQLPLIATVKIELYYFGTQVSNRVVDTFPKQLMPSIESDGIFHRTELDSNGHLINSGFDDYLYIEYFDVPLAATHYVINLDYKSAVFPKIKYMFLGDHLETELDINRSYDTSVKDQSTHTKNQNQNVFSFRKRRAKYFDFTYDDLTDKERIQLEIMARVTGSSQTVIIDGYKGDLVFGQYVDRLWGYFSEQIEITRRVDRWNHIYTSGGRVEEH